MTGRILETKTKPFAHQAEVFERVKDLTEFAFLWEMGTGKTRALIDIIAWHYPCQVLIVCPKCVMENWRREIGIHSYLPLDQVAVLDGSVEERIEKLTDRKINIAIINFEGTRIMTRELETWLNGGIMIIDEAQRIKNHKALQTKACFKIGRKADRRYIATGTPILNSTLDIFSLYMFLDLGKTFGLNFYHFRNRYFQDKNAGFRNKDWYFPDYRPIKSLEEEVHKLIYNKASRKLKSECLDLPPKIYQRIDVTMSTQQQRMYDEMRKELIVWLEQHKDEPVASVAQTALTKCLRLSQITSGFLKADNGQEIHVSDTKLKILKEVVDDIVPAKVIIWAYFRANISAIREVLREYEPVVMFGETPEDERKVAVQRFQEDPKCKVFIGQPRSAGLGITLTAASYAIYYSQGYSLEDRLQSEDRCHRAGSEQHDKITYIDLVCPGTIDEQVIEALRGKNDLASSILDHIKK